MILAAADIVREVDRAFILIGGVSLVLLIGITIAMVVIVVRYRRSRATTTSQIAGHKWLEVTWIVIPTLIVTWMFFVGYQGFPELRQAPEGAMLVEVTGRQWMWSFHYPEQKLDTSEMVVPVNTPVKVQLTSPPNDVIHSFFIPDFRVKEDALPGKKTHLWFQSEREGNFNILCAEFCGKDHSRMLAVLRVVSQPEFEQWVRAQEMKKYQPLEFEGVVDPNYKMFGKQHLNIDANALYQTFCLTCHGKAGDGSGLPGVARNFTSPQDWKRSPKVTDIFRTLTEGVENTQMRPFPNLTPWERVALAHKVRSFLKGTPPQDSREDYDALVKQYELDKVQGPGETIPIEKAMEIISEEAGPPAQPARGPTAPAKAKLP